MVEPNDPILAQMFGGPAPKKVERPADKAEDAKEDEQEFDDEFGMPIARPKAPAKELSIPEDTVAGDGPQDEIDPQDMGDKTDDKEDDQEQAEEDDEMLAELDLGDMNDEEKE